jgi:hypothetical protein
MSSRSALGFDAGAAAARALGLGAAGLQGPALQDAARASWERLDDAGRAALGAILELGGSASVAVLEDEVASELEWLGATGAAAREAAQAALAATWESGLLARDRASRTFYLLPEVASAFAPFARARLQSQLPELPVPPQAALDEHLTCCAINVLRHEPIKLTREGSPFRRGLETLAERLGPLVPRVRGEKDVVGRIDALVALLREQNLLRLSKDVLEIDAEAVEAWSALDEPARAAQLLPPHPDDPALRLLRLVMEIGPERAWPGAVAARVLRRAEAAATADEPAEPLLQAHVQLELAGAVAALERAGLIGPVAGAPGSWGLTAVGRSFPAAPRHQRPKGIHVGHDLAVLVPRGIPASIHARLGDVARLESADQVAKYRLDRLAVLEALDRGATAAELELFLAEHATPVLPDTVRDDLRRWAERFGEVTSRAGICVSCSVPRRHEEFEAVVTRSGLSVALVAPGVAVVAPEDHAALCQLLTAAGLTPRRRIQPLMRGASSAVPPREPFGSQAPRPSADPASVASDIAALPSWMASFRDPAGRKASPPPTLVALQVKEKYRREFGSGQLAALDRLDVDELIALEDKGLVRQFLAGRIPAPGAERKAAELDEYLGDELVSVTPARARQVMERAAQAGVACQLQYLQGPGRTQKLLVTPLEVISDGAGTYVRAKLPGAAQERMLATDRIHALRVIRPGTRPT